MLSVIILSNTLDEEVYRMNCRCLESLFGSEEWQDGRLQVILVESNKKASYSYNSRVEVVVPEFKFNFHQFLNIGLDHTRGDYVAFCNNDILFTKGWFSAIMKVKVGHMEFMCFSPLDRSYPLMGEDMLSSSSDFYVGWENKKHFAAWCFVWERKVFDTIGRFDETFDFYSADDDELQTLRYYAIPNVVVTHSEVKHLSQVVTNKLDESKSHKIEDYERYPLTKEEIRRGYSWLWDDERFYVAYQRMKAKWGNEHMRQRVDRFFGRHPRWFVRPMTKLLYNRRMNSVMCVLTGIKK